MTTTDDTTRRPPIWTGHLGPLDQTDLEAAKTFYRALGLRLVHDLDQAAIMEMRGGTHLVLRQADGDVEGGRVRFDFMVEDLNATHAGLVEAGLEPGPIVDGANHQRFAIVDPSGHEIPVFDSHVVGTV
ncbi:MAG: VOC family protein [Actinomycetota bacterium]